MIIWAWIPARADSKGIPHKNRRIFAGKPLWIWSYLYAKQYPQISRIILSTDDPIIKEQASEFPDITIHHRSAETSGDFSRDSEVLREIRQSYENQLPDWWIQLRPTYPCRPQKVFQDILESPEILSTFSAFRTVIPIKHPPLKTYMITPSNIMIPVCQEWYDIPEPYDAPRQLLGDFYWHNGCIDGIKDSVFEEEKTLLPLHTYAVKMSVEYDGDIDTEPDWMKEEQLRENVPK